MPSFPAEIQVAIQAAVLAYGCCLVEDKPFWCLRWSLSLVDVQDESVVQEASALLPLWTYTWPRSSLKEAIEWGDQPKLPTSTRELACT